MNIKELLKERQITLTEFAKKIKVSRPTLNEYIKQYEAEKRISNDKLQIVFDKLFSNLLKSEEFDIILDKYSRLIDRDEQYGLYDCDVESTNLATNIFRIMKNDLKTTDHDNNIYKFIQLLILNYRKDEFLRIVSEYFLIFSAQFDPNNIEIQKKVLFSNLCKLSKGYYENKLEFNDKTYGYLIEVYNKLVYEENEKLKMKEEEINKHIRLLIEQKIKEGNLIDNIDIDGIIDDLIKNRKNENN